MVKLPFRLWNEVFRHANRGPAPVKNKSSRPMGIATLLKNGAPTVTVAFSTAFEITGNKVPQNTANTSASKIQLLKRKPLSRETIESSLFSLFKWSRRRKSKVTDKNRMMARKTAKNGPMLDCAKACTEETIPLRVRNVPKMLRKNVRITSETFHTFSIPRFS